jgi:hypothetical protein
LFIKYYLTHSASDKVYQLLAHGRWFSPGTPTSSTAKTGRHDIAEILLKVRLNTINQSINQIHDRACVSGIDFAPFYDLLLDFRVVPTV